MNLKMKGGWTPLMVAAQGSNPEFIQALIDAGADVKAQNDEGDGALSIAVKDGHHDIVRLLSKAGTK